jgi:hypothetical protein
MKGTARLPWVLCVLLCLANASLQCFAYRGALDDGVENRSSPSSGDSRDYVRRARQLAGAEPAGFKAAFRDGFRTPGYPLFLAAFQPVSAAPLRAARLAQILLSASMAFLAFLTLRNLLRGFSFADWKALGGAAMVAVWPPLYHFSPILIAETCSLFLMALLLWILSRRAGNSPGFVSWAGPSLLFGLLVYLKPNHFLLLLPLGIFLGRKRAASFILLSLAMIAPWSVFVSLQNRRPVLLSTASDMNLYLGTGAAQDPRDANTLPYRFARYAGFGEAERAPRKVGEAARAVWREHPARTSFYGATKVLHGFGFSLRGPRDVALALLLAGSAFFAVRLGRGDWGTPGAAWPLLWAGILLVTAFQLFVYLPNQRLKTVLFDLPALLILALGIFKSGARPGIKDESSRFSGKARR